MSTLNKWIQLHYAYHPAYDSEVPNEVIVNVGNIASIGWVDHTDWAATGVRLDDGTVIEVTEKPQEVWSLICG